MEILFEEGSSRMKAPGRLGAKPTWAFRTLLLLATCFSILTADSAWGQSDEGSINGVVQDAAGASVVGATIEAIDQHTSFHIETVSDKSGIYSFPPLKIGTYTVVASADGFEVLAQRNIAVAAATTQSVTLHLQIGAADTIVDVTTAPPPLQTEDAAITTTLSKETVTEMPLVSRNPLFLAQLSAGIMPANQGARGEAQGDFSANGQRSEQNNFILDGVDNNASLPDLPNNASFVIKPPPDAIEEFEVQTTDFSAQLGHSAGAVVNESIKSGSNDIHGDLWEYLRNNALNARNYFPAASSSTPKPAYRENNFGMTFGGPILKRRLFFFGDAAADRIVYQKTGIYTVPTLLMRQGDFSELSTNLYQTTSAGRVNQMGMKNGVLTQNVLQPSQMDSVAKKLFSLFPAPTPDLGQNNFTTNNYSFAGKSASNTTQFDARADWNITLKDQMFARYSSTTDPSSLAAPFGGILDGAAGGQSGSDYDQGRNFTTSETHVFSPTLVNELRFGYNWIHAEYLQPNADTDISASEGLGGVPFSPLNGGLPFFYMGGVSGLSNFGSPPFQVTNEYENVAQLLDNVTKVLKGHTIHTGTSLQRIRVQTEQPDFARGVYDFTGYYTGDPRADVLEGDISFSELSTAFVVHNQRWYNAAYLQDDWKASRSLTFNIGVRYDYFQPWKELDGRQANFIPDYANSTGVYLLPNSQRKTPLSPAFLALLAKDNIALQYSANDFLVTPDRGNFAPRLGASYRLGQMAVVRAGYGIFYGGVESVGLYPNLGTNSPFDSTSSFLCLQGYYCPNPGITLETGFSQAIAAGLQNYTSAPALRAYQSHIQTPYSEEYNVSVEKALRFYTGTVSYVGASSHHLQANPDPNEASQPTGAGSARPFPDFGAGSLISYAASSNYNSLQATLQHRASKGLQFMAAYTYSHSLDDAFLPLGGLGQSNNGYKNPRVLGYRYDYGDSLQDVRHRVSLYGNYLIPLGKGHTLHFASDRVNNLAGGWSGGGVLRAQTGEPEVVYADPSINGGNGSSDGVGIPSAYRVANPYKSSAGVKTKTVANWVNPAAFANPPVADGTPAGNLASYGPRGRTMFFGPGYRRADLYLSKDFGAVKNTRFTFRAEMYNVSNTPALGQPANTLGSDFGQITSERFNNLQPDARVAQFGLKYLY